MIPRAARARELLTLRVAPLAFAFATAACQTLIGIEPSPVATSPDAVTDAGPDVTVSSTAEDAAVPDGADVIDDDATLVAHDAAADADADAICPSDAQPSDGADGSDAETCIPLARRCNGNVLEACSTSATWNAESTCDPFCRAGACEAPPSCSGVSATCGTSGDPRSCCASHLVPGGTFTRDYDGVSAGHMNDTFKATVSAFLLDDFEVSVERFKRFVDAYPATTADGGTPQGGSVPAIGSGKNANDPRDVGWASTFTLPRDRAALIASVSGGDGCDHPTWGPPSHLPIACATYYVAYAFCVWDGGRLPTEAEWNFAAAGGGGDDGQRVYPWSQPSSALAITSSDAVYAPSAVLSVGAKLPLGQARWHQADLAGNLGEWVRDAFNSPYAANPCVDCADHTAGADRAFRGGDYTLQSTLLRVGERTSAPPEYGFSTIGFRCARSK